jgi:hypothetical protein
VGLKSVQSNLEVLGLDCMSAYGHDSAGNTPAFYEEIAVAQSPTMMRYIWKPRIRWLRRRLTTNRSIWAARMEDGQLVRW